MDEFLIDVAPIAREAAAHLCRAEPGTDETCAWYHGGWLYLRILGLVSTPESHEGFYSKTLKTLAETAEFNRVLISGNADHGMLAVVLAAYRHTNAVPEVTALDICDTPLHLCKWYAGRVSQHIDTITSDILDLDPPGQFDVICCHSFLTFFPHIERLRLLQKWQELLRPGGRIVTVTRIRSTAATDVIAFTPDQARSFAERTAQEAETCVHLLDTAPQEIAELALRYAERIRIHPICSPDEITDLLTEAGLSVLTLDLQRRPEAPGTQRLQ